MAEEEDCQLVLPLVHKELEVVQILLSALLCLRCLFLLPLITRIDLGKDFLVGFVLLDPIVCVPLLLGLLEIFADF